MKKPSQNHIEWLEQSIVNDDLAYINISPDLYANLKKQKAIDPITGKINPKRFMSVCIALAKSGKFEFDCP